MSMTVAKVAAIITSCYIHAENPKICPKDEFPAVVEVCKHYLRAYNELPGKGIEGLQQWQWMTPRIQNAYIAMTYNLQVNPREWIGRMRRQCTNAQKTFDRENQKPVK